MRFRLVIWYSCLTWLALATTASLPTQAASMQKWLVAGPWGGLAGLSLKGLDYESLVRPSLGDPLRLLTFDGVVGGRWQAADTKEGKVDLLSPEIFGGQKIDHSWSRGTAYGAIWLRAASEVTVKVILRSNWPGPVWLNGEQLPKGQGQLRAGWNLLLVKVFHRVGPWWFSVELEDKEGKPYTPVETSLLDPLLTAQQSARGSGPLGSAPGEWMAVNLSSEKIGDWFLPNEEVQFKLQVAFRDEKQFTQAYGGIKPEAKLKSAPAQVLLRYSVVDYDGQGISSGKATVAVGGKGIALKLERVPLGFYAVRTEIWDAAGEHLWTVPAPRNFGVIRGPLTDLSTPRPRKIASALYWPGTPYPYLERIGITFNLGSNASWWNYDPPGDKPRQFKGIDEMLKDSQAHRVEITGYLSGGWPAPINPRLEAKPKQLLIWFWHLLPPYDTPEYEETVGDYTFDVVSAYQARLHVWKGQNEVDLFQGSGYTPDIYVAGQKVVHKYAKAADPNCFLTGNSLVRYNSDFTRKLFELGFYKYQDAIDIHAYPQDPPRALEAGYGLGNGPQESYSGLLDLMREYGVVLPLWYGEVGARATHFADALRGQAEAEFRMIVWALAQPTLEKICFLIPWDDQGDIGTGHRPATCVLNMLSHLLDGFNFAGTLDLAEGVTAGVWSNKQHRVIALWSNAGHQEVEIAVARPEVTVVDVIGRPQTIQPKNGILRLVVDKPMLVISRLP